jgi:dTDP-4-amino-4,6-dideoxygalactose transaminase
MFAMERYPNPGATQPPTPIRVGRRIANASSALAILIKFLKPARVWLPSYLCDALVETVAGTGTDHVFYEVGHDLTTQSHVMDDVSGDDLVVVIHYFGFKNSLAARLRSDAAGPWLVEDASQALLTAGIAQDGHFTIYSPRKFIGVPDGGILFDRDDILPDELGMADPPADWFSKAVAASVGRRDFDEGFGDRGWFELFRESESSRPIGAFRMSAVSAEIIDGGVNYEAVASRRRANFTVLAERLGDLCLFRDLPEAVVPLGCPVRVPDRERVLQRLVEQRIYPPVHWRLAGFVPDTFKESHRLSNEAMTIPCDQRYDPETMARLASSLLEAMGEAARAGHREAT